MLKKKADDDKELLDSKRSSKDEPSFRHIFKIGNSEERQKKRIRRDAFRLGKVDWKERNKTKDKNRESMRRLLKFNMLNFIQSLSKRLAISSR